MLSIGIVGLPNVGKSTLFNALLKEQQALAANYPFATIEPNVGIVPVPDARQAVLAEIVGTSEIKPATVEFVDIAGLVSGAHKGEGLGNQFLSHIREVAAVCHVLRAFENSDIIREGSKDPAHDLEIIRTELQLADIATLEKQAEPKGVTDKSAKDRWKAVQYLRQQLEAGVGARLAIQEAVAQGQDVKIVTNTAKELCLLSAKPELFVINVSEAQLGVEISKMTTEWAEKLSVPSEQIIVMCNQIESELATLTLEDATAYLADLGLEQSGLDRLILAAYQTLQLQSYLTAGEKEVRAWTIPIGATAPEAAGVIHSDFAKHFIAAKIVNFADFVEHKGWKGAREVGKLRTEGRDYVMRPDDVVEFAVGK
ncbi:MAG: redox-regulated ATPase YchF [Patescibacteria group bacterium]